MPTTPPSARCFSRRFPSLTLNSVPCMRSGLSPPSSSPRARPPCSDGCLAGRVRHCRLDIKCACLAYNEATAAVSERSTLLFSDIYSVPRHSPHLPQRKNSTIGKEADLRLPPGGVAVAEVGLSPGREHDGAVLLAALGEGKGKGGGAAHNLARQPLSVSVSSMSALCPPARPGGCAQC